MGDSEYTHEGSNVLALATAGPRAEELSDLANDSDREKVFEQVLPLLNQHFKDGIQDKCELTELKAENILDMFVTDWHNDPLSRGCWRHTAPLTANIALDKGLRSAGNLFFSGEGTCYRHSGWVTGGWYSGEKTAKILLKKRRVGFEKLNSRTLCDFGIDVMEFNKSTCEWTPKPKKKLKKKQKKSSKKKKGKKDKDKGKSKKEKKDKKIDR